VEITNHRVWLYYRFPLSLRDIEEMMAQRGVIVSYETILDQKSGSATPSHDPRDSA
jgi:transposase-like protein